MRVIPARAGAVLLLAAAAATTPAAASRPSDAAMAERLEACAACHGEAGRSSSERYFPSIAGKPAGYLESQLHNFRDGRRRHTIMEAMLALMSDEYLADIAAYYARQEPKWTPPASAWPAEALARGRTLVEEGDAAKDLPSCASCHGESLKGVAPFIPSLLGVRPEYLSAQLGAWRSGARKAEPPDCMAEIAQRLGPQDIGAVTAWIASLPYPADHRPQPSLPHDLPLECGGVR
ncbi:MAG: cytochrome c4 [Gammaproteobacteria bacterium]|nr:cytochrome c4 [Gammaproteobacteria bacterium]